MYDRQEVFVMITRSVGPIGPADTRQNATCIQSYRSSHYKMLPFLLSQIVLHRANLSLWWHWISLKPTMMVIDHAKYTWIWNILVWFHLKRHRFLNICPLLPLRGASTPCVLASPINSTLVCNSIIILIMKSDRFHLVKRRLSRNGLYVSLATRLSTMAAGKQSGRA